MTATAPVDFHSMLAAEMRHVELAPATRGLPGAEKKAAVIKGLRLVGALPEDKDHPLVTAAEVAIDALIWAIRHKRERGVALPQEDLLLLRVIDAFDSAATRTLFAGRRVCFEWNCRFRREWRPSTRECWTAWCQG